MYKLRKVERDSWESCYEDSCMHQEFFKNEIVIYEAWHIHISVYLDAGYAGAEVTGSLLLLT